MAIVLVVDDDAGIRESAAMALRKVGHRVHEASDAESALQIMREHKFEVVVSDIYMPGADGISLLQTISERKEAPRVILMTARGSIETTALAHRIGAFDYLAKPFELSELIARVAAAVKRSEPENAQIEPAVPSRIIGSHPAMIAMYKAIARVASLPVPVLIFGESGSGKELVAQSIHDLGARAGGPFVAINCGAIPDTLLENELFGSTRGAFTDARADRRGALSRADGGTLFLDEIGDISPSFQVKLLRFLQDGSVTPLGAEKSHRVDVRAIAATHRDIKSMVAEGTFREDLYYRLAGYEIAVPPLRKRQSDIPLLVEHFKQKVAKEMRRESIAGPTQAVLDAFIAHAWPGNVRELEQVVRRAIIDSGALIDAHAVSSTLTAIAPHGGGVRQALSLSPPDPDEPPDQLVPLDEAERRHILAVLQATAGNQTQAAFILGIERKTLARKLKRYGIKGDA
ncbi:MAG TPA: sigma-54 dependent transcriptional regulator [Thermoanaerobaculia bacterium]|nr:sigma-54 dependent transcriptional regulator [Thermoanaerobaculia bacterium]